MLKQWLYRAVEIIADIHSRILSLNNAYDLNLTDKQLHFLVIGLLGMGVYFAVFPIFRQLILRRQTAVISWGYTVTVILGITLAIEVGQHISRTGSMEFADIVFGVAGYLLMFGLYLIFRVLLLGLGVLFAPRRPSEL